MSDEDFKKRVIKYVENGYYAKALGLLQMKVNDLILSELIKNDIKDIQKSVESRE